MEYVDITLQKYEKAFLSRFYCPARLKGDLRQRVFDPDRGDLFSQPVFI
jgi:hypothetical protein